MDSLGYAPGSQTVGLSPTPRNHSIELLSYPNPTSGELYIDLGTGLKQDADLHIYNALGQRILSQKITTSQGKIYLDTQTWQPGTYSFQLHSPKGLLGTGRFIRI